MLSARNLRHLRESGQLGIWRIGSRVYISLSELDGLAQYERQEPR